MKIAIQGHPTRGKEVIQILESLGGKNTSNWHGNGNARDGFFIDNDGIIRFSDLPEGYKLYTLEEFEKEFPFKIGDKITNGCEEYFIIDIDLNACVLNYKIRTSLGSVFWIRTCDLTAHQYKQVKEMKEERNITLTLDKAKEWYKKGGELKEVALQAYSEEELNPRPRSWEEFCEKCPVKLGETYIDGSSRFITSNLRIRHFLYGKNICPSKKSAEAHLAMIQLEQLRNCWWNGWKPEWNNCEKYVIKFEKNDLIVFTARRIHAFLVFPTREMAEEFLKCFRDLIEKAGDLI